MHSHPNPKPIRILWEHVEDASSVQSIRQAVELILAEMEPESTAEGFDKIAPSGHAEGAPVESDNQSMLTAT